MPPELVEVSTDPGDYLAADDVVQADSPGVRALAAELRSSHVDDVDLARAAFEWVRDEVAHTWDAQDPRVTVTASEVLTERVGLCFAKSHLLAALLRAEGVATGFCYQRLADEDRHVVHGLVAVRVAGRWHRQDPRGNKTGVDARFSLGEEHLAWTVDAAAGEVDYPQVYAVPHPLVLAALRDAEDALALCRSGLPDAL